MPRMYAAVLREDWTREELAAIQANPVAQKLSEKARANVWYPTLLQLVKYQYVPHTLSEDERTDIAYHVETDRCKRSLRLLRWFGTAPALRRLVARVQQGASGAMEGLEKKLAKIVSFPMPLEPVALSAGPAERVGSSQRTVSDDGQIHATLSQDGSSRLWLALEDSTKPAGTLLRITLTDDDGTEVWQGFVMLRRVGEFSVGKASLDIELAGNCSLVSEAQDTEELAAADADLLSTAFARAQEDDPSSVPVWRGWAEAATGTATLDDTIRQVLLEIVSGSRIACFDLEGTIVDHEWHKMLALMPELLRSLHDSGWDLKIVTAWGRAKAEEFLAPVYYSLGLPASEVELLSSPDKAGCILGLLTSSVREIVFVDDKPENIRAVAQLNNPRIRVFGYLGSGKYARDVRAACRQIGVAYAPTALDLAEQLGVPLEPDATCTRHLTIDDLVALIPGLRGRREVLAEILNRRNELSAEVCRRIWKTVPWIQDERSAWWLMVNLALVECGIDAKTVSGIADGPDEYVRAVRSVSDDVRGDLERYLRHGLRLMQEGVADAEREIGQTCSEGERMTHDRAKKTIAVSQASVDEACSRSRGQT